MELFDTHAHLCDERFNEDRDDVARSLSAAGIRFLMEVGCDVREDAQLLSFIDRYDFMFGALGMHPHTADAMTSDCCDSLRRDLNHPKIRALGEIGLDYHYDFSDREIQKKAFALQLEIAGEMKLPVVLHTREATADTIDILRAHKQELYGGILHCFTGSYETARICLDMGLHIAFGGALTFKNGDKLRETARKLPLDRLLLETDCPYMTPEPYRGKRCTPAHVELTCNTLAGIHNISPEEMARITLDNACKLLHV